MKRKNSLKKLAGFLGIASVSSLISVPVLAQMDVTSRSVNPSVSQRLEIAQNTPGTTGETGDTMNTPERMRDGGEAPGTMRREDGGVNTPGTMNEPAGEMTTPEGMRQREGMGTPSDSNRPATDTNIPENITAPAGETNAPGRLQRQGESTTTPERMRQGEGLGNPGTMQRQDGGTNTPGTMNEPAGEMTTPERMRRQGEGTNTPGTMNTPAGGMNNPARGISQSSLSPADRDFVMKAAQDSMAEIQLGQLAKEKATTDAVKAYGQIMIDHHTQAAQELMQLASQKGLTLPTEMSEENRVRMERLSKLSGREFDSAYMQEMVKDHAKDVSFFQSQTQQGQAQELKTWAADKLPLLQEHLQMARSMTPEG